MAAVMFQEITNFYTNYSKSSPANTNQKKFWVKNTLLSTTMIKCAPYSFGRYHILEKRDIKELLQKVHAFCFNYQHLDFLFKRFKCQFSWKIVVKSGQFFEKINRAVHFNHQNHQNKVLDRMPKFARKETLEKKVL